MPPLLPHGLPVPPVTLPQVTIQVQGPQALPIESTIPSPGGWAQIVAILLAAAHVAHERDVADARQAGGPARLVVPGVNGLGR